MIQAKISKEENIIQVPDNFAQLERIDKNGFFVYKIRYLVDVVKAIQAKALKTKIHISEEPFAKGRVKSFKSNNPEEIIENLLLRQSKQKDFARSKKDDFLLSTTSDISSKIPNNLAHTLSNLGFTDRQIVRTSRRIRSLSVDELNKEHRNLPVLDENIATPIEENLNAIQRRIRRHSTRLLFQNSEDPANVATENRRKIRTARQALAGINASRRIRRRQQRRGRRRSERNNLLSESLINRRRVINQLQLEKNQFVNAVLQEEHSSLEITKTIHIPVGDLLEDEFFVVFQLQNNDDLNIQTISRAVSHSKNISNLSIPTEPPEITKALTSNLGKNLLFLKQIDENATSILLFKREVKPNLPNFNANYSFITSIDVSSDEDVIQIQDPVATINPIVYRAVAANADGILSAEFSSIIVKQDRTKTNIPKRINPYFVSLTHEINEDNITIDVNNIPSEPIALKLFRKNLSRRERGRTLVGDIILLDDTIDNITIEDTGIKRNRKYEYTVDLIFIDGTTITASNNLILDYNPTTNNIINLTISEPQIIQETDDIDIQFEITKDIIENDNDLIKNFLQNQGLSSDFQDQIIDNRDKLQSLFAIGITRTNLETGELEDFGIISSDMFSDKQFGRVNSVKPIQSGFSYRYNLTVYARAGETLYDTLEKTITKGDVSFSFKPFKWRHPVALTDGNITTEQSRQRNHANSNFSFGTVVETTFIDVSLTDANPALFDAKAQFLDNDSVFIQWKVQGNSDKIDHFIITLETLGMRTVIGKSHNITNNASFHYIDNLDNDESGALSYIITPVFFDYSRGEEIQTNEVVI